MAHLSSLMTIRGIVPDQYESNERVELTAPKPMFLVHCYSRRLLNSTIAIVRLIHTKIDTLPPKTSELSHPDDFQAPDSRQSPGSSRLTVPHMYLLPLPTP